MVKKIFMVDDDTDDQETFRKVVEGIDAEIEVVFSGHGALALEQLTTRGKPDIIFMDCVMPVMDGIECLTMLKASKNTRQIPVIMYTSSQNHQENELAIKLGALQLIRKTSSIANLDHEIREVISLVNQNLVRALE